MTHPRTENLLHISFFAIVCGFIPASVVTSAFVLEQNVVLLLLSAPAIIALLYRLPHIALIIMSLSVMFIESLHFNLGILPRQVTWLTDVVIILIAIRVFTCGRARLGRAQDPFRVPLLIFTGLFLCSAIVNSVSFAVTLVTIRQYFKYIILYLAITGLPFSSKRISGSLRFFFLLILIQVPIIAVSFLLGVRGDFLSAGLGSGGTAELATDDEIRDGIKLLARSEGVLTETAGGVTMAVAKKLIDSGKIPRDESIVISITGNGLKTQEAIQASHTH